MLNKNQLIGATGPQNKTDDIVQFEVEQSIQKHLQMELQIHMKVVLMVVIKALDILSHSWKIIISLKIEKEE